MDPHKQPRVDKLLEQARAAEAAPAAHIVLVQESVLAGLVRLVEHFRGAAAGDRPARDTYHCARCGARFRWLPLLMPYLCAEAEKCAACRPLCELCLTGETAADHVVPPRLPAVSVEASRR